MCVSEGWGEPGGEGVMGVGVATMPRWKCTDAVFIFIFYNVLDCFKSLITICFVHYNTHTHTHTHARARAHAQAGS